MASHNGKTKYWFHFPVQDPITQALPLAAFFLDKYRAKRKEKFMLKCSCVAAGVGKTYELNPASYVRTPKLPL